MSSFDSSGRGAWSSVFPSNQATFSVERVPRGFLLLLVNLDTKTKDEFIMHQIRMLVYPFHYAFGIIFQ